jgi:hypothetical protein
VPGQPTSHTRPLSWWSERELRRRKIIAHYQKHTGIRLAAVSERVIGRRLPVQRAGS